MILIIKAVFGAFYLLFLPGLLLTYCIFKKGELNILERIGLSIGLSVVIVPSFLILVSLTPLNLSADAYNELSVFLKTSILILFLFLLLIYKNKELVSSFLHNKSIS